MAFPAQQIADQSFRWWKANPNDIGAAVIQVASSICTTQLGIQARNLRNAMLFGGNQYFSGARFSAMSAIADPAMASFGGFNNRTGPRQNLIYSVISTVHARMLAAGYPTVTFLTSDGDFELQHRAKQLEKFCDGLTYQSGLDAQSALCLLDCLVFGSGFMKFWHDDQNNIHARRVFPNAIWTEMWDGKDRDPKSLFMVDTEDKDVFAARFKDKAQLIRSVKPDPAFAGVIMPSTPTNVVAYFEAWHKPSEEGGDDGRHVIALSNDLILVDEKWDGDFPITMIRYQDLLTGYLGMGLAELLYGHQSALNDVVRAEYWAHSQFSLPKLYVNIQSKINKNHVASNRSGQIWSGVGEPPTVLNYDATTQNFVQYKEFIIQDAFAQAGVSQMSAQGVKPAGLNSAPSQREYMDIQQDRFAGLSLKWGQFRVDCVKQLVRMGASIYKNDKGFKVKVIGKNFLKEIKWKDVHMDEDEYRLQLFPTSSLPKSPAGKLQMVQEMLTAQLISPQQGIRLLNMPDLDQEMSLLNAARDNAFLTAHKLLHEDGPVIPDATLQDLPQCIPIVLAEAIKAFDNGAPEEKIKRCRTWLTQARLALQPPPTPGLPTGVTAPPPGIQVPPPSAGAGVPTPRPVAQLKPQAPLPGAQPAA